MAQVYSDAALGGSAAVVPVTDAAGKPAKAMAVMIVSENGQTGDGAYTLASGQALTAQAGTSAAPTAGSVTPTVTVGKGGSFLWDIQITGTSPSIILQALGADGVIWRNVATATTSGTTGVVVGQGAKLRLFNNSANVATVSSNLT